MDIKFTKMHGLGNDFVVIDAINQKIDFNQDDIRKIADRNFGVGCDQLLLVERPTNALLSADHFRYRIFNANGGEVEQCGNGARCFARFVREKGLSDADEIHVQTLGGNMVLRHKPHAQVAVQMGIPTFVPREIPFDALAIAKEYPLEVGGEKITITTLAIGNPHAIYFVENIDAAPVETLGPQIESHSRFRNHVNAVFAQVIDQKHIAVRVYERGAGETLACGSGACAAVIAGVHTGRLDGNDDINVRLKGGPLKIFWGGGDNQVYMIGPAETVFEGVINL